MKAQVNGAQVVLNVSGGSFNGWTDWLSNPVAISVNHSKRVLHQLAEVSLSPKAAASLGLAVQLKPMEAMDQWLYSERAAKQTMLKRLAPGVKICLGPGYDHCGATEVVLESVYARKQALTCVSPFGRVRVHYRQVAWVKTLAQLPSNPVAC